MIYLGVDAWQTPNGLNIIGVICGIVSDNVSNNWTMIEEFEKLNWKRFKGEPQWIRCFAHILNLIIKAVLRPFGRQKKPVLLMLMNPMKKKRQKNLWIATMMQMIATPMMVRMGLRLKRTTENLKRTMSSPWRISRISKKRMTMISILFPWNCNKTKLKGQLASMVRCEDAIIIWQQDKQFGTNRDVHVTQADLDLAQDLVQLLEQFYKITLQLSTGALTRFAEVVVWIDQITADLSTVIANDEGNFPPALRNVSCAGLQITNKYYMLTNCSPSYRIAMILHPSFKDEDFKLPKWPQSWVDEAIDLTRQMYETLYKPKNREAAKTPKKGGAPKPQTGVLAGLGAAALARLAESFGGGKQKRSGNTHHGLLCMALDVMTCPATTVDVKRTFNFGQNYVTSRRHNLHAKSVSRGMALLFYSKNSMIKPLALHEFMAKRQDELKMRLKVRSKNVQDVVTVE
ncbi:hypothetical protein PSTG_06771 [Puccinia striiformis f. sp. tritici PST-78]|uniref:HAT C-terminal dimerisation domain-containing protein n=1 Tax=Puccinia striiformis f. sp. tritici PST-78 TaxID=1165861 RepID=A0A0L0VKX2_9BASI|nr:hypothetical protein PSTG_06771 [Puccinia striiformis f. sp. tritici PST-78]